MPFSDRSSTPATASSLAWPGSGGVPWVWKLSMVFRPQAWPLRRSASVQVIGFQSGASTRRAPALATSTRLPPGS